MNKLYFVIFSYINGIFTLDISIYDILDESFNGFKIKFIKNIYTNNKSFKYTDLEKCEKKI